MPIPLSEPITETPAPITYDAVLFPHIEIHTDTRPDGSLRIALMFEEVPYSTGNGATKDDRKQVFRNLDLESLAKALPEVAAATQAVMGALVKITQLAAQGAPLPTLP